MSRLGQGSDTTACPWCEGNIDPSGGYFSKLDDNHKSHNSQGFTIFSQFSRSQARLLNHERARMGTKVGSREKKGEGSAWMARLGAPARRFRRASIEKERTTKDTKNSEPRMDTNAHEWIKPRNTRNTRKKTQNHEWTRMGTNGLNHEKYERHEKLRTTNGHECTRKRAEVIEPRMGTNICGRGAITIARMWVVLNCGRDAMRHLLTVRPSAKWGIA